MIKKYFMGIVDDFSKKKLDLKRLNFGVTTLIPKLKDANNIWQYRPICLINVSFNILTKMMTSRLGDIAHKVISESQYAFIKGRNILDG